MVAENSNKIFVIQGGSRKAPDGYLRGNAGRRMVFVADPAKAPAVADARYARPDDARPDGRTWRQYLVDYNSREANPSNLYRAIDLYAHPVYAHLARQVPVERLYVLSAAWGLVRADFRLPSYEVSLSHSPQVPAYARRSGHAAWSDFSALEAGAGDEVIFIGGNSYIPLFDALTSQTPAQRLAYRSAGTGKGSQGLKFRRFDAKGRNNWYYDLAYQLVPQD